MENFNYEYLVLALLGLLIHILMKIAAKTSKKNKFSLKVYFADRMNFVRIAVSILSIVALLMMALDLSDMMKITLSDGSPAITVFAFLTGYFNHSLIYNVLKMFKRGE